MRTGRFEWPRPKVLLAELNHHQMAAIAADHSAELHADIFITSQSGRPFAT